MDKSDWNQMKDQLKKAVDKGVKILKEGGEGARYVAGQTAHVLQLEMDTYGIRTRIAKLTYRLGEEACRSMKDGKVQVTSEINRLASDLSTLKESLKRKENEIRRTNLTRTTSASSRKKKPRKAF